MVLYFRGMSMRINKGLNKGKVDMFVSKEHSSK